MVFMGAFASMTSSHDNVVKDSLSPLSHTLTSRDRIMSSLHFIFID